jgi:hypothetical protein
VPSIPQRNHPQPVHHHLSQGVRPGCLLAKMHPRPGWQEGRAPIGTATSLNGTMGRQPFSLTHFIHSKGKREAKRGTVIPLSTAWSLKQAGQVVHEHTQIFGSRKWNQLGQDLLVQPRLRAPISTEKLVLQLSPQGLPQDRNDSRGH